MNANPDDTDLDILASLLRDVARDEILPRFGHTSASAKADGSLVTEADLAAQRRLLAACREGYPDIPMLGEEMSTEQQQRLVGDGSSTFWCLDPLDGTSNFACGFPGFSISLALMRGGNAEMALILDPVRDECFTAARGCGAFLNGEPIRPFAPGEMLADCLAMVDFKRLPPERIARLFSADSFRSQRNLGSVALDWCWLAAGRFQLYLHGGQKLWDYAAGRLIADEAGVISTLFAPNGDRPLAGVGLDKRTAIAAANQGLFERWLALIDPPVVR